MVAGHHVIFVGRAGFDSGYEALPNAGIAWPQRIRDRVPAVEISNYGNPFGVGGPHCEMHSGPAIHFSGVSAHLLVGTVMRTLREEVEIVTSQKRSCQILHHR